MKRKRELTAWEEQQILEKDPKYRAMIAEREKRRAEMEAMLRREEKPLIEALEAAGWPQAVTPADESGVKSVWDFVNTTEPYPHLLNTLAEYISRPYHPGVKEGIARSLAVRESRDTHIPRVLMNELKKLTDPKDAHEASYRWALINTLVFIGDSSLSDDARQLLEDPRYAEVKKDLQRLAKAITRSRRTNQRRRNKL